MHVCSSSMNFVSLLVLVASPCPFLADVLRSEQQYGGHSCKHLCLRSGVPVISV